MWPNIYVRFVRNLPHVHVSQYICKICQEPVPCSCFSRCKFIFQVFVEVVGIEYVHFVFLGGCEIDEHPPTVLFCSPECPALSSCNDTNTCICKLGFEPKHNFRGELEACLEPTVNGTMEKGAQGTAPSKLSIIVFNTRKIAYYSWILKTSLVNFLFSSFTTLVKLIAKF